MIKTIKFYKGQVLDWPGIKDYWEYVMDSVVQSGWGYDGFGFFKFKEDVTLNVEVK